MHLTCYFITSSSSSSSSIIWCGPGHAYYQIQVFRFRTHPPIFIGHYYRPHTATRTEESLLYFVCFFVAGISVTVLRGLHRTNLDLSYSIFYAMLVYVMAIFSLNWFFRIYDNYLLISAQKHGTHTHTHTHAYTQAPTVHICKHNWK